MNLFEALLRPVLFRLDPERAHALAIEALRCRLVPLPAPPADARLAVTVAGFDLPNPVGMAAGFDKNAVIAGPLLAAGFGFVEIGTVTPRPQSGNPRPRLFRLERDGAIINRMGFNNDGQERVAGRLAARTGPRGIVGVNIGANRDSPDFIADYVAGLERLWDVADYFTANISSPNTPGLRDLQGRAALGELLARLLDRREQLAAGRGRRRPGFVKIAPDLDNRQMDAIAAAVEGTGLDGLIIANTTLSRHGLRPGPHAGEAGGLSGRPLFERSTIVLARMRQRVGSLPLVGVGGIDGARSAIAKLEAGANLIQFYTGMVYRGPALAGAVNRGLVRFMAANAVARVGDLTGRRTGEWASRKLPEEG